MLGPGSIINYTDLAVIVGTPNAKMVPHIKTKNLGPKSTQHDLTEAQGQQRLDKMFVNQEDDRLYYRKVVDIIDYPDDEYEAPPTRIFIS